MANNKKHIRKITKQLYKECLLSSLFIWIICSFIILTNDFNVIDFKVILLTIGWIGSMISMIFFKFKLNKE